LDSPGPVVIRQSRIGKYGRPFELLKFRTVRVEELSVGSREEVGPVVEIGADGWSVRWKRDVKVTSVGALLRATGLDELPQLWSVIKGDMALVGPRPRLPHELAYWAEEDLRLLLVKPGLTGLSQLRPVYISDDGRSTHLDEWYLEHWSPMLDAKILAKTVVAVLRRADADRPAA
jgi:lipopolysaccharide/colanic/teichoic acid biosynthesis glycosyltransferase